MEMMIYIPTCSEEDNEMWEEFFASITSDQPPLEQEEPDDDCNI